MFVVKATGVNEALQVLTRELVKNGTVQQSRNGPALTLNEPVAVVYETTRYKILTLSTRHEDPTFHVMDALWMLAGRDDVRFLKFFNKRISDYSDDGLRFNGAYGHRIGGVLGYQEDNQLMKVINYLQADFNTRQAVLQIWRQSDLDRISKDKPCNMSVVFKSRKAVSGEVKLDMTVFNRSNDLVWGLCGSNVVQFSMLFELVCSATGYTMGKYTHVTNCLHAYTSGAAGAAWERVRNAKPEDWYSLHPANLLGRQDSYEPSFMYTPVTDDTNTIEDFTYDCALFFAMFDRIQLQYDIKGIGKLPYVKTDFKTAFFKHVVIPMFNLRYMRKVWGEFGLDGFERYRCQTMFSGNNLIVYDKNWSIPVARYYERTAPDFYYKVYHNEPASG